MYGASIGILMLETRFPRIHGDLGHAGSWHFPVHYRVVRGATANMAVQGDSAALLAPFIEAAKDLTAMGADGITTSCGFLSPMQQALKEAIGVPVVTSSLAQLPWVESLLPAGKRAGVLTIHSAHLSAAHLLAAGASADTPVVGTESGREFTRVILNDEPAMDVAQCRDDIRQAARQLLAQHPDVAAIVLECTNMVPYAADVQQDTGLPVYTIHSLINWFQAGLAPPRFAGS